MTFGGAPKVKKSEYDTVIAEIAARNWNDYKTRGRAVEEQLTRKQLALGSEAERKRVAGLNTAAVEQAAAGGGYGSQRQGSGAQFAAGINETLSRGAGRARGSTDASVVVAQRGQAGLQDAIHRGRGIETTGINAYANAAAVDRARNIAKAQAQAKENEAFGEFLGSAVGTYGTLYGLKEGGGPKKDGGGSGLYELPAPSSPGHRPFTANLPTY